MANSDSSGTVKQRGDDGASNTQWSAKESGEATNGGFTDDGSAPYDQPDAYRDIWTPENSGG